MAINEWESYALCSRIKTKRQKERLRRWDSDKQLIRLHRELERLGSEQRNLGYKELVPPIQRGWKRVFVLRPDVARSKDGAFFQALLQKINTEQFSHRRDFKQKKRRKGKKVRVERIQKLYEPYAWAYKKLKLTEKEKTYFAEVQEFYAKGEYKTKYVFNEPWRYVLKVVPNLITKVRIIDPLLQQQAAEIENYLERNGLIGRQHKLMHGRYQNRNHWNPPDKAKYQYVFKTESLALRLEEFYDNRNNEKI